MKTIVTHNSSFHTDDIFAVATLMLAYPEESFKVVRTRDDEVIEKGDLVVDVGQVYDPSKGRFDHHQAGGAGKRNNGIPYASFGLVWKELGERICGSADVQKAIDDKLIQPVDAADNGVNISKPIYEGVYPYTLHDFLYSYKKVNDPTEEELYQTFIELVEVAKGLLAREISNEKIFEELRNEVREAYANGERKDIVLLEKRIERNIWRPVLSSFAEPIFVIYPSLSNEWKAEAVPVRDAGYESRKPFPAEWAGKTTQELAVLTGISDMVFCHNSGFLASAKTKGGALAIAELALNS